MSFLFRKTPVTALDVLKKRHSSLMKEINNLDYSEKTTRWFNDSIMDGYDADINREKAPKLFELMQLILVEESNTKKRLDKIRLLLQLTSFSEKVKNNQNAQNLFHHGRFNLDTTEEPKHNIYMEFVIRGFNPRQLFPNYIDEIEFSNDTQKNIMKSHIKNHFLEANETFNQTNTGKVSTDGGRRKLRIRRKTSRKRKSLHRRRRRTGRKKN